MDGIINGCAVFAAHRQKKTFVKLHFHSSREIEGAARSAIPTRPASRANTEKGLAAFPTSRPINNKGREPDRSIRQIAAA